MSKPKPIPPELSSEVDRLEEYAEWRDTPAVYFLVQDGKVIYVGQTVHVHSRIRAHCHDKNFDRVFYIRLSKQQLAGVESEFIRRLDPPLNGPDRLAQQVAMASQPPRGPFQPRLDRHADPAIVSIWLTAQSVIAKCALSPRPYPGVSP